MKQVLVVIIALHFVGYTFGQTYKYKFGSGLKIINENNTVNLKITGRIQTLFTSERIFSDNSEWDQDLLIRRARIKSDGYFWGPQLAYKLEFGLSERDQVTRTDRFSTAKVPGFILDAVLKYKTKDQVFEIWAGQTKLPGNRERVVSSSSLQFVDRSLVNSIFNIDREIGVQFRGNFMLNTMPFKAKASISLGEVRNALFDALGGYHYSGRVELYPFGSFTGKGAYFDSDLNREATPKLMVGSTFSFNDNAMRQRATGGYLFDSDGNYLKNDLITIFLDAILKYRGFSIASEYAYKKAFVDPSNKIGGMSSDSLLVDANGNSYLTGSGINLQAAYLFKTNFEIGTRITHVVPDRAESFTGMTEYTLGLSQYFNGHKLKLQADISYTEIKNASNDELRYRVQFELAF